MKTNTRMFAASLRADNPGRSQARGERSGFTLIELLVVMGLIILLAAITISVSYSGLIDNYRTIGAGDRVSRWLVIAKVKAQRDQVPTGVRFYCNLDTVTGQVLIKEAQYIQAPDSYVPLTNAADLSPPLITITKGSPNTVKLTNINTTTLTNNVADGDTLVLPEFRTLLRIQKHATTGTIFDPAGNLNLATPSLLPDIGAATKYSTTAFGFLRSARPMVGEDMLLLTGQTAIDPSISLATPAIPITAGTFYDVLFAPNGEVLGTTGGSVILWIRDPSLATSVEAKAIGTYDKAGQQGLVTVYTKTGSVATHPVTRGTDPYAATKDGINTGCKYKTNFTAEGT